MIASDIMTTKVSCLAPEDKVGAAVDLFFEKGVRQIPVVNKDNAIVWVVTSNILLKTLLPFYITEGFIKDVGFAPELPQFVKKLEELKDKSIEALMKELKAAADYAVVSPDTTVMEIAAMLINDEKRVSLILVGDGRKRLLGIISPVDVFRSVWTLAKAKK